MPVKRIGVTTKDVPPKKLGSDLSGLSLPLGPKEPNHDLNHYTILLYGREKIGKTQIFSTFPESLFFATEPGTKGLAIAEFNSDNGGVKDWDIFRRGVELLEADRTRYKTVVIDTVDRAYDMALDWVCDKEHIEHPGTSASGEADFGKSWRAVRMEFMDAIHRISQTGRGICFTSHVREEEFKDKRTGEKYNRIMPSMSGQARKIVEAIVDMFFYAEYVRGADGETKRILICQGDETIWAGARSGVVDHFPQFLPMDRKEGYQIILDAFSGESAGIQPSEFSFGRGTSRTGKEFLQKAKLRAIRESKE